MIATVRCCRWGVEQLDDDDGTPIPIYLSGNPSLLLEVAHKYSYDVFGNRVEKKSDMNGNGRHHEIRSSPVGNENRDVLANAMVAGGC